MCPRPGQAIPGGSGRPSAMEHPSHVGVPGLMRFQVLSHRRESETWPPSVDRSLSSLPGLQRAGGLETDHLGKGRVSAGATGTMAT